MDFKEFLDKYVFKASHPLTESAKQREEALKAILIENELKAGKKVVIAKAMDNQPEPLIIEGRPFTPDDLQHLDELNEEMLKQNPPKPYQWGPQLTPQSTRELMYARFFGRPIILDTPSNEKIEN